MKFSHPYLLNLLWLFIVTFGIMAYGMHQRKKIITAFLRHDLLRKMVPGYSPERRWTKACLILFASVLGILALAGPLAGFRWEKIEQKGVDIMIALDCSKSMLAKDIKPDRLSRAKREIIDLLRMMKSDRAGLVAFSGRAILQCPLTLDHESFHIFLNALTPDYLPMGGTNLETAIRTANNGFEQESGTDKAIILITDGENTTGDAQAAAKEMAEQGIKVFTIGVGDINGAPIPDENGGFKKDAQGRIVMSKVDETVLKKIAALTGGAYVRSVAGDMDLDLIYKDKIAGTMERKKLASGRKKVWENRFQWFLFPCVLLLLIELIVSSAGSLRKLKVLIVFCLTGLGLVQGTPVHAGLVSLETKQGITAFNEGRFEDAKNHFVDAQLKDPDNESIYYNIGAAAYMSKDFDLAESSFLQAAQTSNPDLKHKARYNLANTYYRQGRLDDAIKGYEDLLEQYPDDIQAKENLAFVKQKREEQKQQSQQDQEDKKSSEEKEKSENKDQSQNSSQDETDLSNNENNTEQKNDQSSQGASTSPQDKPQQDHASANPEGGDKSPKDKPGQSTADTQGSDQSKEQESQTAATSSSKSVQGSKVDKQLEQKLNRLEDKPGTAMMPRTGVQIIEKDW